MNKILTYSDDDKGSVNNRNNSFIFVEYCFLDFEFGVCGVNLLNFFN